MDCKYVDMLIHSSYGVFAKQLPIAQDLEMGFRLSDSHGLIIYLGNVCKIHDLFQKL